MSGWGWFDASFGGLAAHVYFAEGTQRIRIYQREDGISIDQIVISAGRYLTTRPGAVTSDMTTLSK
jgi:hypothetical protein